MHKYTAIFLLKRNCSPLCVYGVCVCVWGGGGGRGCTSESFITVMITHTHAIKLQYAITAAPQVFADMVKCMHQVDPLQTMNHPKGKSASLYNSLATDATNINNNIQKLTYVRLTWFITDLKPTLFVIKYTCFYTYRHYNLRNAHYHIVTKTAGLLFFLVIILLKSLVNDTVGALSTVVAYKFSGSIILLKWSMA